MEGQDTSDSAEEFDPYSFAERWYTEVWPEKYPIEYQRYIQALKTLGREP